jgi:hypothetical protein
MKISAESINNLPQSWQLTPLGKLDNSGINPKAPYLDDWQKLDLDRDFINNEIASGKAIGIGLRLGEPSGYIVAIDFDGQSAIELGIEKFGEIPITVTWTSGRPGRYQALFVVPEQYREQVKNKKVQTGVIGDDGKTEQLELRYTGNQSALPPSPHPETDGYKWINNPIDTQVAELPQSAIDYWLSLMAPKVSKPNVSKPKSVSIDLPPILLENCLAKSNREILKGIGEGGRNQAGATLARDLIGCANYLEAEGINFKGDPRDLFDRFVESCSPPIDSDEADTIWRSAQGDNPEPSCRVEGIDNIIEAWKKKHTPKEEKQTVGDRVLEIARQQVIYFHTADKVAYADISIDGNRHTYAVRSKAFRLWLSGEYLKNTEKGIGSQTLQDTLNTLEAIAIFRGETREVNLRTAEHQGKIYLDLGTEDWKAIEIDSLGWRIVSEPPVRFWRPESLLPLPIPVEGGSLDELRDFLNVDDSSWILIASFLLFCFCPDKTYPVLVLSACRGSGKTAAAEILKGLVDPGKAGLIKLQGDTHKLAVAATRRHLMVYDNVGHINPEQSDDLCRIATGFGYSTRTLHTTDEETTFELTRPQIITAIDALVTRDDLADRVLMAQLPEIPADKRLPQGELNAKVEAARPRILGALLTALSQTLAELPNTKPKSLPRMADYALFSIASETALGFKKGEFMKTFDQSREQSRQIVIESSPVGEAMIRLMEATPLIWKGTASQLLKELENHTDDATYRSRYFPKASNALSRQLTRLAPDLKAVGIEVGYLREGQDRNRLVCIEKVVKISSLSSIPSADDNKVSQGAGLKADDITDDIADGIINKDDITDDIADGIMNKDDTRTITPSHIVHDESQLGKGFQPSTDDKDDKDDIFTTFSITSDQKNISSLEIGDRVQMGGDIITVEKIEGNIVCGRTDDDSYIGGSIDSVTLVINEGVEYEC